jgi:hypothetical protein
VVRRKAGAARPPFPPSLSRSAGPEEGDRGGRKGKGKVEGEAQDRSGGCGGVKEEVGHIRADTIATRAAGKAGRGDAEKVSSSGSC